MTSIKLTLSGAVAQTETDGIITEGMKGLPVTIVYDEQWDGLYKTLVCKSAAGQRSILGVEDTVTVAPEVLWRRKWGENALWLGVEGRTAAGELVLVSTMAYCGKICPGASTRREELQEGHGTIWAQIKNMIGQLQNLTTKNKTDLVSGINEVADDLQQWKENGVNAAAIQKALGYTPGQETFLITLKYVTDEEYEAQEEAVDILNAINQGRRIYIKWDNAIYPASYVETNSAGTWGDVRLFTSDDEQRMTISIECSASRNVTRFYMYTTPMCGFKINGTRYWPYNDDDVMLVFDDAINAMIDAKLAAYQNGTWTQ